MTETVVGPKLPVGPGAPMHCGYGFYELEFNGKKVRGHSGGGASSGIGAHAEMLWEGDWTLIVLGNYDLEQDVRPLTMDLLDFLTQQ